MNDSTKSRQRGAALIYALTALVFLGLAIAYLVRQIRLDRNLVLVEAAGSQALFLALSGEDWIHYRLGPRWEGKAPLSVDQMLYRVRDSLRTFSVDGGVRGALLNFEIQGSAQYPFYTAKRTLRVDIGQNLELSEQPAIGLLDRSATLALGFNAIVKGPILLYHGQVKKAEFTKVDYTGKVLQIDTLWDSASTAWKRLPFSMSHLSYWMAAEAPKVAASQDLESADSLNRQGAVFRKNGTLRLKEDFHGDHARLTAVSIEMVDGASCNHCVLTALNDFKIRGNVAIEGGQFLAGDSLLLDIVPPIRDGAWFLTVGKSVDIADGSARFGAMDVRRLRGEAVIFTAGTVGLERPQWMDLTLSENVDIEGMVYCAGVATLAGRIQGSVLVHHLSVEKQGTVYINTLVNTHVSVPQKKKSIRFPIAMVGIPYSTLSRE